MNEYMSDIDALAPSKEKLVALPYDPSVFLCFDTFTRWRETDSELLRDSQGEHEWKEMAAYVNKTYEQVFMDAYNYAIEG